MKLSHWIAVGILALMVSILTYAMNYLGGSKRGPETAQTIRSSLRLSFPQQKVPPGDSSFVELELNTPGVWDYWFTNQNAEAVKVGLLAKSCKCASVEMYLFGDSGQQQWIAAEVSRVLMRGTLPDVPFALPALALFQDHRLIQTMTDHGKSIPLELEQQQTVPANAGGLVRLHIKTEQQGPREVKVELWTEQPGSTPTTLQASTVIVQPLMALPDTKVGVLTTSDLPREVSVTCFSLTRESLTLKPEIERDGRSPDSDPIELGSWRKLTPAEARLAVQDHLTRSAYSIQVKLKPQAKDGTPFELGSFRRRIIVRPEEFPEVTPHITLSGQMEGDVAINGLTDGAAYFGTFEAKLPHTMTITIESDTPGLALMVDTKRSADFVTADLTRMPVKAGGHQTWKLKIKVLAGEASGRFPSADHERYRDSAVYLKTEGSSPRSIRIPVAGTATHN
jgi:hypothetical protein